MGRRNSKELGAILALAMGLGKTLITLASVLCVLQSAPPSGVRRVIILCPASLLANRMIFLGADWDPANDAQLSRRCWRSGQQKPVIVWRIVTRGGLDARILERAQNKEELRKVVASGGTGDAAASAAVATKQHDLMSDLIYREAATTPAN